MVSGMDRGRSVRKRERERKEEMARDSEPLMELLWALSCGFCDVDGVVDITYGWVGSGRGEREVLLEGRREKAVGIGSR